MTFAKWVFMIGGVWGVLIIGPLFFAEGMMAETTGRPFNHPDTYYGFVAAVFCWQLSYLVISRDPARYRPFMLLGALGKLLYAGGCWVLFVQGRIPITVPAIASPDLLLVVLFVIAWLRTAPERVAAQA